MCNHPFREETPPNVQPKLLLAQPKAVPVCCPRFLRDEPCAVPQGCPRPGRRVSGAHGSGLSRLPCLSPGRAAGVTGTQHGCAQLCARLWQLSRRCRARPCSLDAAQFAVGVLPGAGGSTLLLLAQTPRYRYKHSRTWSSVK